MTLENAANLESQHLHFTVGPTFTGVMGSKREGAGEVFTCTVTAHHMPSRKVHSGLSVRLMVCSIPQSQNVVGFKLRAIVTTPRTFAISSASRMKRPAARIPSSPSPQVCTALPAASLTDLHASRSRYFLCDHLDTSCVGRILASRRCLHPNP